MYDPNCAFKHRLDASQLTDYDMAIVLEPKHSGGYRYRADVLSALGRDRDALKDFETALGLYPNSPRSQLGRGHILAKLGLIASWRADYERTAALRKPNDWLIKALHRTE